MWLYFFVYKCIYGILCKCYLSFFTVLLMKKFILKIFFQNKYNELTTSGVVSSHWLLNTLVSQDHEERDSVCVLGRPCLVSVEHGRHSFCFLLETPDLPSQAVSIREALALLMLYLSGTEVILESWQLPLNFRFFFSWLGTKLRWGQVSVSHFDVAMAKVFCLRTVLTRLLSGFISTLFKKAGC